jgi:hypothetical protein
MRDCLLRFYPMNQLFDYRLASPTLNLRGCGERISFNECGKVTESFILAMLGSTPREPPTNRRIENSKHPTR